jgi:hypothetical protein
MRSPHRVYWLGLMYTEHIFEAQQILPAVTHKNGLQKVISNHETSTTLLLNDLRIA